jgi:hypothetical protein
MTIAEKLARAKTDIDEVHEAGYAEGYKDGKTDGFDDAQFLYFPILMQGLALPTTVEEANGETLYSVNDYNDTSNIFSGWNFYDLCERAVTSSSQAFELTLHNTTQFVLRVCVRVVWDESTVNTYSESKVIDVPQQQSKTLIWYAKEGDTADDQSWQYSIKGARFMLNEG